MREFACKASATVAALGITSLSVLAATGYVIARKLTTTGNNRKYPLTIRAVEHNGGVTSVVLDRTPATESSGLYNLWFENGDWAQLGPKAVATCNDHVSREVTGISQGLILRAGERVSWSGIYYAAPDEVGLQVQEIPISTTAGIAPAWLIQGSESIWAIHIHGLGSSRAGTLRGAKVATKLGYTSLIVSYRNEDVGPTVSGVSTLGLDEVEDVRAAIEYAVKHGAKRIILFGWSMGANIALQLAAQAKYRDLIIGVVLDSPVLDWSAVIKANCKNVGLPAAFGSWAIPWLTKRPLARLLKLPRTIPLDEMNWVKHADRLFKPTLILHGSKDDSVPVSEAISLLNKRADLVTLEIFEAGHTRNWNADPERWDSTVASWLEQITKV